MLGRLDWSAIPLHEPLPLAAAALVAAGGAVALWWVIKQRLLSYLWREWITSVDHKRIGVLYCLLAVLMLIRGLVDAVMMRTHQAVAVGASQGYLPPDHYDQIFSAHGTLMIFFGAMPFLVGLMNFVVPLQIGARDVAFPTLNAVSFWVTASGALLVNISLIVGEFARTGWLPYAPLSETRYSPGVGVDYYLWAIQIAGVGTLLSGINLVTTIVKLRAPGMTMMRMPMFCWTALGANLLIVAAFPILTATVTMLTFDRYLDFHFFTNEAGGNPMMFVNMIWAWGHPEVYILILPAFGIFSEIFSTFSGKPLFGYRSMVAATLFIVVVSFTVWLHHFFTMGAGADVNAAFGIATSVIAVGTGVKIFNWIFTMWGGTIRFETPMLWSLAFLGVFTIGGMTGVLLAVPPADFVLHNSMFLVAHFHNVIVGGVIFGAIAGYSYWFPKAFGFRLHEGWGKIAFWLHLTGFAAVFAPMYWLGLEGMTRRLQHIHDTEWTPLLWTMVAGVMASVAGTAALVGQLIVSIRARDRLRDETGDPWHGRTLEWSLPSPPAFFNYAVLPQVEHDEAYWCLKSKVLESKEFPEEPDYRPIELPRRSATGVIVAFFSTLIGFAAIWHIWWLVIAALVGVVLAFVAYAWRDIHEEEVPAEEVARLDREARRPREQALARLKREANA